MQAGRPTKLSEETTKIICESIRLGMSHRLSAMSANVAADTMATWINLGKKGKEPYVAFLDEVEKADADCIKMCLSIIRKAAIDGTWTAAAWLLERRYPVEYAK